MAFWDNSSDLLPKQSHRWVISFGESEINSPNWWKSSLIPHYFAKSVSRPSFKLEAVKAKYLYSHTFNFPKRLEWSPIKIEFYDVLIKDKSNTGVIEHTIQPKIADSDKTEDNYTEDGFENYYQKSTQLFFQNLLFICGYVNPNEYDKEDKLLRFRDYNFKTTFTRLLGGETSNSLKDGRQDYSKNYLCISEIDGDGNIIEKWRMYNPLITSLDSGKLDYSTDSILSITIDVVYDWAELIPMNKVKVKPPEIKKDPPQKEPTKIEPDKRLSGRLETGPGKVVNKKEGTETELDDYIPTEPSVNLDFSRDKAFTRKDEIARWEKMIEKYENIDTPQARDLVESLRQSIKKVGEYEK